MRITRRKEGGRLLHNWFWYSDIFHIEWCLFKDAHFTMLMFEQNLDGDDTQRQISLGIYGLFVIWIGWRGVKWDYKTTPLEKRRRTVGIRFFDNAIWLDLWGDPDGWGAYRTYAIRPVKMLLDFLFGKPKYSQKDEPIVLKYIELPEGFIPVNCQRIFRSWKRPRWFWPHQSWSSIDIIPFVPIPIPGKGENHWDLDDNAIEESSRKGDDIHEALRSFADDVIKERLRKGGYSWRPSYGAFTPLQELPND
jgi:hypothetical protein